MRIEGAGALVTGGASGLGAATARTLCAAGAGVTVADRDEERGKATAAELGARFVRTDVTDTEDVRGAVEAAGERLPLRIAVNCAGIATASRVVARDGTPHDLDAFVRVLHVNLVGTFNVLRVVASSISRAEPDDDGERGVVVNTASIAAFEGQIGQIAYAASKGGVAAMTLPAARDLAPYGIRVCTIAPGTFETPMLATLSEPAREALAGNIPFPSRLGRPAEFAALVQHVCENRMLNGEVIRLDGALRMPPR